MLNPFPELLTYSLLGPLIIRFALGVIFLNLGLQKFRTEKGQWIATFNALGLRPARNLVSIYGSVQIIAAILLMLGIYTQYAALAIVILSGSELYIEWKDRVILKRDLAFYILVVSIAASLLLTGAGAFAFDIPL